MNEIIHKVFSKDFILKHFLFLLFIPTIILDALKINIDLSFIGVDKISNLGLTVSVGIAALPMAISIISIYLTLLHDPIYGIELNDFRKIRKDFHFSFKDMIYTTLSLFFMLVIFLALNFRKSILMTSLIGIVFSLLFVKSEIPILCRNEKYIDNIIRQVYISKYYENNNDDESTKIFEDIVYYMILKKGIIYTFNCFKMNDNDTKCLDYIIGCQSSILLKKRDIAKGNSFESDLKYKDIDLITIVRMSFDNIEKAFNLKVELNESNIYNLSKQMISLEEICSRYQSELFDKQFKFLFERIYVQSKKQKDFEKFSLLMNEVVIRTVSDEKTWFLEIVRSEMINKLGVYVPTEFLYLFMIEIFYYVSSCNMISGKMRNNISNIVKDIDEKNSLISSSLNKEFINKDNRISLIDKLNILKILFKIKDQYNGLYDFLYIPSKESYETRGFIFNKNFIFNDMMELMLYNSRRRKYEINEIMNLLHSFNEEERRMIAKELSERWINSERDDIVVKHISCFSEFCGLRINNVHNDSFIQALIQFTEEENKKYLMKKIDNINNETNKIIENKKEKIINTVKSRILEQSFVSTKPIDSSEKVLHKEIFIPFDFDKRDDGDCFDVESDVIANSVENAIKSIANLQILHSKKIKTINDKYTYDNILELINKYNIDCYNYISFNSKMSFSVQLKDIIEMFDCSSIYPKKPLIWNHNSIAAEIQKDNIKCCLRDFTDKEVNELIDSKYSITNHKYKFYEYGSTGTNALLTRDELFDMLKKQKIRFEISVKFNLIIEESHIFKIKK